MKRRKVLRPKGHSVRARFLLAFLCFLTNLYVNAQTGRHFDADKQMSSSFTTQVYQDHDGFIWVATRNGLNRYDGYQFRIIKKEKPGNNGMASNYWYVLHRNVWSFSDLRWRELPEHQDI